MSENIPILYSLQNCPYAMRARMAIYSSQEQVLLRAIKLNNKPDEMLLLSPKGSVPVLVVPDNKDNCSHMIIEESLEVMLWALSRNDPDNLLLSEEKSTLPSMISFIIEFEYDFVLALSNFSSAKRYHDNNWIERRLECERYLQILEDKLTEGDFLFSQQESLADIAIMPFIRKFARVEKKWFRESPYPKLRHWLNRYLQSPTFSKVMENHELWINNRKDIYFGG
ncbi:glutathione S-transferase [Vibrio sp. HN007]|uniref:glutathione S-transferase n=1 Tax=Vibrio iocasae TaxID=3098914 RepID=UPI0035D514B9